MAGNNSAVLAVAGARKTEEVILGALADPGKRVLITTFTNENLRQIRSRIESKVGVVPENVELKSWYSLLIRDFVRPFQVRLFDEVNLVAGTYFGDVPRERQRIAKDQPRRRYLTGKDYMFKDRAAELAYEICAASNGEPVARLEKLYDHVFVDEVQDLVGWDLELLQMLFESVIDVTLVGDPRQHTYSSNRSTKNKKYQGAGFTDWLQERAELCEIEFRTTSYRCEPGICELASKLFPDDPALEANGPSDAEHCGVHFLEPEQVGDYVETHSPVVLRYNVASNTLGHAAMNIGVAKGSTFDHVLIFPTGTMKTFLRDHSKHDFGTNELLYVAITRARHSAAIVM